MANSNASRLTIDFSFIKELEGGVLLSGYVLDGSDAESGVRIANGIDLGLYTDSMFRVLKISPVLRGKLYPYVGKKGDDAKSYLKEFPLRLSENEAENFIRSAQYQKLESLISLYKKDSGTELHLIPSAWQTVIASLEIQYSNINEKHPLFWQFVTKQNWGEALSLLRNFGDQFSTRRNTEADYIELHWSATN